MKIRSVIAAAVAAAVATSLTACSQHVEDDTPAEPVGICYGADGPALLPLLKQGKIDYAFLAEPAATTAVNNLGKSIVMDAQEQWKAVFGGSYPQACLIAKGSVARENGAYVESLLTALEAADGWAEDNAEAAIAAVKAHMEEGTQSSLPAAMPKATIERCNVKTVRAAAAKSDCEKYFDRLTKMTTELGKPVLASKPADAFYYTASATSSGDAEYKIFMPDGAPAIAMAKLMAEGFAGASFTVVPAATIAARVTGGAADFAIMPVNAAASLAAAGRDIVMLSVNTHGNLYFVGDATDGLKLSDLAGKKVGVIGQGQVPDLTLKMLLDELGIKHETATVE